MSGGVGGGGGGGGVGHSSFVLCWFCQRMMEKCDFHYKK